MFNKIIFFISLLVFLTRCSTAQKRDYSLHGNAKPELSSGGFISGEEVIGKYANQILTYDGTLSLDLDKARHEVFLDFVIDFTKKNKGYVDRQTLNSATLKVPSDLFKSALLDFKNKAESLGGSVDNENVSVTNITDQFYDTKIRIDNAQKLQQRLTALLKETKNVEEAIKVETELSRVTQQLEILQGRMKMYQNQVDFSTIHVYLRERVTPGPLGWVFYGAWKAITWLFVWN